MDFESLFLKQPTLTDHQNQDKLEQVASLANNFALQESLDVSIRAGVVEALTHLSERDFEKAFAALVGAEKVIELKNLYDSALERVKEQQSVKATDKPPNNSIKY